MFALIERRASTSFHIPTISVVKPSCILYHVYATSAEGWFKNPASFEHRRVELNVGWAVSIYPWLMFLGKYRPGSIRLCAPLPLKSTRFTECFGRPWLILWWNPELEVIFDGRRRHWFDDDVFLNPTLVVFSQCQYTDQPGTPSDHKIIPDLLPYSSLQI